MFETCDLSDLACLASRGFRPVPIARRGALVFFNVEDLSPEQAECLLQSPEQQMVGRYHQEWRRLRRAIDTFPGNGGGRP